MADKLPKGFEMEEQLRNYFLQSGYFVVRGVPFVYEGFDVTDIDLWLYSRESSLTRSITIVDVKNKKTPQAIERIFWAKGLAKAVKANKVIVATTDKRKEVKDFGFDLDVLVLDGTFLSKLTRSEVFLNNRLSDEEFISEIEKYSLGKIDGDWKGQIVKCKSLLSKEIGFDECNQWLEVSRFFAEQILTKPSQLKVAIRCFYYSISLFCIGVDFVLKELSFLDHDNRVSKLVEGFTFGTKGRNGVAKMLSLSLSLVEQFAPEGKAISSQVRTKVMADFDSLPTNILGEYFSKAEVGKTTFSSAKELENLAMSRLFRTHSESSIEVRSVVGCLLDCWGISRKMFTEAVSA
ncbi:hypothetical protein KFE26_02675 [Shewanella sp. M16]|uniref:hypothetical protein n=1 Tax=Shewanella TaxID=22 RepID=UPI001BAF0CA4|nr:hypothetical protein [Shewanella sp. M16]MBS0041217.1 hypothetical protein [Shewanella sp. M16]